MGKGIQQPVDMLLHARPALSRKAGGLVEHDGGAVLGDDHRLGLGDLFLAQFAPGLGAALGRGIAARRDADNLAGGQAVGRIGALAIHADLPGAGPAADHGKADLRQVALEPAVQPHSVIIVLDGELANVPLVLSLSKDTHAIPRARASPANSPPTPPSSERAI